MIAALRIHGQVDVNRDIKETLNRLKMQRKLVCVFVDEKDKVKMGMLKSIKDYVSYGSIDESLMNEIIEKRGQRDIKGKFRGFCRLHPPIGGFKRSTKASYPSGILGNNKDIAKLLKRML